MEREAEARIKADILHAEELAKKARHEIDRARRAGIDVSKELKDLLETERRIAMMKAVYVEGK